MKTASKLFSSEQQKELENAVGQAETRTSAEFVCAVATESGRYDRAESMAGIFVSLIGLTLVHLAFTGKESGSFEALAGAPLGWQMVAVALGFAVGNLLASYWHALRRLLVPVKEMLEESKKAARSVFALRRLSSVRGQGGVLLYYSIFERRMLVLMDEGGQKALGQVGLTELREFANKRLREAGPKQAFLDTLERAAGELSEALPPDSEPDNQVSNQLLLLHPRP